MHFLHLLQPHPSGALAISISLTSFFFFLHVMNVNTSIMSSLHWLPIKCTINYKINEKTSGLGVKRHQTRRPLSRHSQSPVRGAAENPQYCFVFCSRRDEAHVWLDSTGRRVPGRGQGSVAIDEPFRPWVRKRWSVSWWLSATGGKTLCASPCTAWGIRIAPTFVPVFPEWQDRRPCTYQEEGQAMIH